MNSDSLVLVIDSKDTYQDEKDVFLCHPCRIDSIRCVTNNSFDEATIKNSPVSSLSALNLVHVLEKVKPLSKVEIYIDQPITVMQEYDAKQVEANAKLAGFEDISIKDTTYEKEEGKKVSTLLVTLTKPEKVRANVEISVTTKTVSKSVPAANKKKGGRK